MPDERRLNADIQVLRAAAILMVLIEHVQINLFYWRSSLQDFQRQYWEGKTGVDLFFVISGFVISRNLVPRLQACASGTEYYAETATFLLRRFWRLQPMAWFWVAFPLLLAATLNYSGAFHTALANNGSAITAVFAINNLRGALLPPVGSPPSLFFPYWSLSLEEQFYLVLPVLVLVSRKHLVGVLLVIVASQWVVPAIPVLIYTRPGALCLGVLLALWRDNPAYGMAEPRFLAGGSLMRGAFLLIMLALLGSLTTEQFFEVQQVRLGLTETLAGVLVYAASFDRGYIMSAGLLRNLLGWVGGRSYALYLAHIPAYALARELIWYVHRPTFFHGNAEAAAHLTLGFALTGVFAELSHRFIEVPCRAYGRGLRLAVPEGRKEGLLC